MVVNIIILALGFFILVKGADFLVSGSSALAKKFNISEIAIGLTVVSLGTSMPEFIVSTIASIKGHNELTYGNVLGSNNFNILMILGLSGIIFPLTVKLNTTWKEIPFSMLAAVLLFVLVNDKMIFGSAGADGLSRIDGLILLIFFGGFIFYISKIMKAEEGAYHEETKPMSPLKTTLMIAAGLIGLVIGGKLIVENAVEIAHVFQLSDKLIGLTIIAAGTSLPELATSAVASYQKKSDIAVGNIVGSNIFNILLVLGLSSMINPINYNVELNVDLYVLFGATLLLFGSMFTGKVGRLDRWEAALALLSYFGYLTYLIIRA